MKKKSLLLCGLLSILSLSIGACSSLLPQNPRNRKSSSNADEPSEAIKESSHNIYSSSTQQSTTHRHQWGEWVMTIAPTCTERGQEERMCECGEKQTRLVAALGHDYQVIEEYYGSCGNSGYRIYQCARCHESYQEAIPADDHNWINEEYIYPSDVSQVGYVKKGCVCGQMTRFEIAAIDGTLINGGTIKSNTPEGFMKLSQNQGAISYTFYSEVEGLAMLYQRAAMDLFSNSTERTYSYTVNTNTDGEGNFRVTVNDVIVDKTPYMNLTYGEMLSAGEVDSRLVDANNDYSPVANCPIGETYIQRGVNTLIFTRLSSYNLTIEKFVIDIASSSTSSHTHIASTSWSFDENYHWHTCISPNCPMSGVMLDHTPHNFVEEYSGETTCTAGAILKRTCTVCGYSYETELQRTSHNWQGVGSILAPEGYVGSEEYKCSYCNQYALRWNVMQYDQNLSNNIEVNSDYIRFNSGATENMNGVESRGARLVYKVNMSKAVANAGLAFKVMVHNSTPYVFDAVSGDASQGYYKNDDGTFTPATKRFGLFVNGVEYRLTGEGIQGERGLINWFDWPVNFPLAAGENIIEIFPYGTYRLRMYEFQLNGIDYIKPNHTHVASEGWYSDGDSHWHECTAGDGYKFPSEGHDFSNTLSAVGPTCEQSGYYIKECTICHITRQENIPALGHMWDEGVITREPSHAADGIKTYTCSRCHETKTEAIPSGGHAIGEQAQIINSEGKKVNQNICSECEKVWYSMPIDQDCFIQGTINSGKMDKNAICMWKIPVNQVGKVNIQLPLAMSLQSHETQQFNRSLYTIKVNGVEQQSLLPSNCSYGDFLTTEDHYFTFAEYVVTEQDVANGEIEIEFDHINQTYRLLFRGEIRVSYI